MLRTLKLNNKKWKKSLFYEEKSLVGLATDYKNLITTEKLELRNREESVTSLF